MINCHCGRNKSFEACCEPILKGIKAALTAEDLMRSRYSAYVVKDINYIMSSHHSATRPIDELRDITEWTNRVKWRKLSVIGTKDGKENQEEGYVVFKAFFKDRGIKDIIYEQSYFKKENNEWKYHSGIAPRQ